MGRELLALELRLNCYAGDPFVKVSNGFSSSIIPWKYTAMPTSKSPRLGSKENHLKKLCTPLNLSFITSLNCDNGKEDRVYRNEMDPRSVYGRNTNKLSLQSLSPAVELIVRSGKSATRHDQVYSCGWNWLFPTTSWSEGYEQAFRYAIFPGR